MEHLYRQLYSYSIIPIILQYSVMLDIVGVSLSKQM